MASSVNAAQDTTPTAGTAAALQTAKETPVLAGAAERATETGALKSRGSADSVESVGTKRSRSDVEAEDGEGEENDQEPMAKQDESLRKKKKRANKGEGGVLNGAVTTASTKPSTDNDDGGGGEWQTIRNGKATKKKKVPKKESGNYPALVFSKNARLQSKIQVSDLRNLVTYLFADGMAPQWIGVHHRPSFRKVVAIMVPGLEEAMFQVAAAASLPAQASSSSSSGADGEDNSFFGLWEREQDGSIEALQRWSRSSAATPHDDCYPRPLAKDRLAPAVQPFADVFEQLWPVRARGNERYCTLLSPVATFLTAPQPKAAEDKAAGSSGKNSKHKGPQYNHAANQASSKDERTRITEFLATPEEYLSNDFVLHPAMLPTPEARAAFVDEPGWVHTDVADLAAGDVPEAEIEQGSITAGRRVYAIDCEMCKVAGDKFVLTRVSVVAWDGEVVLDELVKPDEPIVDYLTQYSGITEAMLAPVTTTLRDIQQRLLGLLDAKAILVGHSLDSDCRALQLTHPFVVDTSIAFPHPLAPAKKHALRWLSAKYLNREIQRGHGTAKGHDSVEDARTCLDLVKRKCEKGKAWGAGSAEAVGGEGAGENLFHRLARAGTAYRSQGGPGATGGVAVGKTTAAVDWGDVRHTLAGEAGIVLGGCQSDADVEAGIVRAVHGDPDGKVVPGGGVDFVWARMRELEALQGWWNRNKLAGGAAVGPEAGPNQGQGPPSREVLLARMQAEEAREAAREEAREAAPEDGGETAPTPQRSALERSVRLLARRIQRIHAQLPPCTALIVFSGSGDPRAMGRLQAQRAQHRKEYYTPGVNWDAISVPWTDTETQLLQQAVRRARDGIAFLTVK